MERKEQISVFMENAEGVLASCTALLADADVNILAFAIFDTPDFGILRMIVDKTPEALATLKEADYVCSTQEILGVPLENKPGSLAEVLRRLHENQIQIEYLYTILYNEDPCPMLLFQTSDNERASAILDER